MQDPSTLLSNNRIKMLARYIIRGRTVPSAAYPRVPGQPAGGGSVNLKRELAEDRASNELTFLILEGDHLTEYYPPGINWQHSVPSFTALLGVVLSGQGLLIFGSLST